MSNLHEPETVSPCKLGRRRWVTQGEPSIAQACEQFKVDATKILLEIGVTPFMFMADEKG
jgi:hypothetical protein